MVEEELCLHRGVFCCFCHIFVTFLELLVAFVGLWWFIEGHEMFLFWTKCDKNVTIVTFLLLFIWQCFPGRKHFLKQKYDKNVTEGEIFVSFLPHFWNGFCRSLNTFLLFVSFLSHFERFLSDFVRYSYSISSWFRD